MKRTWTQVVASTNITAEEMERFAVELCELTVVKFYDTYTDKRWFQRDVVEIGKITTLCADGTPIRKDEMFKFVRSHFGEDCDVLW